MVEFARAASVDFDRPVDARVHDVLLGGGYGWEHDLLFGERALQAFPLLRPIARASRLAAHRIVRRLMRRGVRQFIDLGTGLPTMGQVHEVADLVAPGEASVVYVDHEPVAVVHTRVQLGKTGDPRRHAAIQADLHEPDQVWNQVASTGAVDLGQPVGLLLMAVLHLVPPKADTTAARTVARYRELLSPQSYLAISHLTDDEVPVHVRLGLSRFRAMSGEAGNPMVWRSRSEMTDLFAGFHLIEPGLTWTAQWHPEESDSSAPVVGFHSPSESAVLVGVAQKPGSALVRGS